MGTSSSGEFNSVALTNNYQQADTGTKMMHFGKKRKVKFYLKEFPVGILKILIED